MPEVAVVAFSAGKREQTKLANRQAILDAARAVFGEMGYESASVRDIIRRTGLSVGAFYNYYRSKEEVYQALADDGARRFRLILVEESEKASEDFEGFLRRALYAFFSFQVTEHEAWQTQRPPGEQLHPSVRVDTPEMKSVFEEVKGPDLQAHRRRRAGGRRLSGGRLHRRRPGGLRPHAGASPDRCRGGHRLRTEHDQGRHRRLAPP